MGSVRSPGDSYGAFDAALAWMKCVPRADVAAQCRALNDATACLYRLRNYRLRRCGKAYWELAEASGAGQLVEAVVLVRGAGDHDFSRDVVTRHADAYPGGRTYPSDNLHPGGHNLFWRLRSDLEYDLAAQDEENGPRNARHYDEHLGDVLVLDTLTWARPFLFGAN